MHLEIYIYITMYMQTYFCLVTGLGSSGLLFFSFLEDSNSSFALGVRERHCSHEDKGRSMGSHACTAWRAAAQRGISRTGANTGKSPQKVSISSWAAHVCKTHGKVKAKTEEAPV